MFFSFLRIKRKGTLRVSKIERDPTEVEQEVGMSHNNSKPLADKRAAVRTPICAAYERLEAVPDVNLGALALGSGQALAAVSVVARFFQNADSSMSMRDKSEPFSCASRMSSFGRTVLAKKRAEATLPR